MSRTPLHTDKPEAAPALDARTEAVLHRVGDALSAGAAGTAVAGTVGAAFALASGFALVAPLAAFAGLVIGGASQFRGSGHGPTLRRAEPVVVHPPQRRDGQGDAFYGGTQDPELARGVRALGMSPDLITRDEARNLVDIHTHMAEREHRQPA